MLIPFKNHPDGLECFSYNVVHYTSKLAPRHFVVALDAVIADKSTNQKDPLDIVGAFTEWDEARPAVFSKKALLTNQELALKDAVDKRFITYMSILTSTHCINIPVRVFCHLACMNGCPQNLRAITTVCSEPQTRTLYWQCWRVGLGQKSGTTFIMRPCILHPCI